MRKTELRVGDVVRNRTTSEVGKIVRIIQVAPMQQSKGTAKQNHRKKSEEPGYVISLPKTKVWPAREVLWRESDVTKEPNSEAADSEGQHDCPSHREKRHPHPLRAVL